MTFREFTMVMQKDPVLRKLLPINLKRTYPRFSLDGTTLCVSFVGFRALAKKEGITVFPPSCYWKVTYPLCALQTFEKLSGGDGKGHLMTACASEDMERLGNLCDEVLRLSDENDEGLAAAVEVYNALLDTMLDAEQLAVLTAYDALK